MVLTVKEVTKGVFHVQGKSQFDIASSFMRLQEFYESPLKGIRGTVFTHERFIDLYAHQNHNRSHDGAVSFSYFDDWAGFNIPGNVFNKWVQKYKSIGFWEREQELIDLIYEHTDRKSNKFYVIGTAADDHHATMIINHELSHAWYYIDTEYRKEALKLLRKVSPKARSEMHEWLKNSGYNRIVYDDESVAYFGTDSMVELDGKLSSVPWRQILPLQQLFEETRGEKLTEMKNEDDKSH